MAEATLKPHKNTIREGMEQALGDFYRTLGYSDNYSRGVGASNLLENTTGLGAFTSGQDAATSAGQGDWKGAAGNLAMAGLAAMPGGSEVKAGVKKVGKELAGPAMQSMRDELASIKAYHGSPYSFDKFDIGKMGSGEGNQMFGKGMYFAENEDVAKSYYDKLKGEKGPGSMYEVGIRADPSQFVDWDKPLAAQSPQVQDAVLGLRFRDDPAEIAAAKGSEDYMGRSMMSMLSADLAHPAILGSQEAVSAGLAARGIPGIRFLDEGSRAAGKGTSNYVTFGDDLVDINRKYGGPEAVPATAAATPRDELAAVVRPPQEKSGVFDYSAKNPPIDLGVQRFVPKKVPERTQDLMKNPEVYDKFLQGMERGMPVKDWYETGPLLKSFGDEFGPDVGRERFNQFIDAVAATSPRSDVGTNVRNASYYYGKAQPRPGQNSIPSISDLPPKNPAPYGHLAQNLHRMNAEKTVFPGGKGLDFKENAKPIAFAANLKGDPSVVTVDTHAFRAPNMLSGDPRFLERSFLNEKGATPRNIQDEVATGELSMDDAKRRGAFWASKPQPTEYAAYEDYYRRAAADLGITPMEGQAASWVGHGPTTGLASAPKSFMDFMEERVLKTARERNMDPQDVWNKAMRGSMPLLGGAGAGVGLGASILSQPGEKQQEY